MPHDGCQGLYPDPKGEECQQAGVWKNDKTFGRAGDSNINDCCGDVSSHLQDGLYEGNVQVQGTLTCATVTTSPLFLGAINVQSWKGFDIKHPSKEGHRLRYVCLEGPEAGVFVRGRLKNENVIKIPDYWKDFVDIESITVSLTQIGHSQDLIVERIEWGTNIVIKSGSAANIDCYYVVHGARIDGEPLVPEYDGESPSDYPGSPDQFSIAGHDYGRDV